MTNLRKPSTINYVRDKDTMALKQFKKTDSKGREEIWEWEETPELKAFIKRQSLIKLSAPPTRPQ